MKTVQRAENFRSESYLFEFVSYCFVIHSYIDLNSKGVFIMWFRFSPCLSPSHVWLIAPQNKNASNCFSFNSSRRTTDWNFSLLTLNLLFEPNDFPNTSCSGRFQFTLFSSFASQLDSRVILKSCGNNRLFYIRLLASILMHIFAFPIDKPSLFGAQQEWQTSNQQELKSQSDKKFGVANVSCTYTVGRQRLLLSGTTFLGYFETLKLNQIDVQLVGKLIDSLSVKLKMLKHKVSTPKSVTNNNNLLFSREWINKRRGKKKRRQVGGRRAKDSRYLKNDFTLLRGTSPEKHPWESKNLCGMTRWLFFAMLVWSSCASEAEDIWK